GFAVSDEGGIPLWTEFQRLGGVRVLGYPISTRYQVDGYVMQAAQRAIVQWRPELGRAGVTNVLDDLSKAGRDPWLLSFRQTPKSVGADVSLLDGDPAIKAR